MSNDPSKFRVLASQTLTFLSGLAGNFSASQFLALSPAMGFYYLGCAGLAIATDSIIATKGDDGAAKEIGDLIQVFWEQHGTLAKSVEFILAEDALTERVARNRAATLLRVLRGNQRDSESLLSANLDLTAHVGRWIERWCEQHDLQTTELSAQLEGIESLSAQQRDGLRADSKHRSLLAAGDLHTTIVAGGSIFWNVH